jgi:sugar/nucleoside kinase (ribokinase family)
LVEVFALGSINQDFVLKVERRPNPGETVTKAELSTHNGGKGANQAAAAALLGASVASLRVVRGGSQCPGKGDIDTTLIPPGTQ